MRIALVLLSLFMATAPTWADQPVANFAPVVKSPSQPVRPSTPHSPSRQFQSPEIASAGIRWYEKLDAAVAAAKQSGRPMVVFLTMQGCGYCQKMKQETFTQPNIAEGLNLGFVAVRLDGRTHPDLARKLRVRVYPTTALFDANGQLVEVIHGYRAPNEFSRQLTAWKSKLHVQIARK